MDTIQLTTFLPWLDQNWEQGEHMLICGTTGSGKTRLESQVLECRDYVVVFAVKRYDDTLKVFLEDPLPTMRHKYKKYTTWPPLYSHTHVVLWLRPMKLDDIPQQRIQFKEALQRVYLSGGWCVALDDAGYASGFLKAAEDMGILLNQGRSSKLSIVPVVQQPHSVIAKLPSESLRQTRHKIFFDYSKNKTEVKSCAEIVGIEPREMEYLMRQLPKYGFLYFGERGEFLVIQEQH
jgi:hypothetical protein